MNIINEYVHSEQHGRNITIGGQATSCLKRSYRVWNSIVDKTISGASYLSSPDQASSVYPDRLIRPLPRRSLKSRLSQEAAESITFPPNPPSTSLPAYSHYGENGEFLNDSKVLVQHNGTVYDHDHEHDHEHDHDHDDDDHDHEHCPHHHCHHDHDDDDLDSADDSSPVALRHSSNYRSSPRSPRSRHGRYGSYGGKGSGAPDGYEAFENTNNKKKRKIPTSGSLSLHHSSLTSDLVSMGIGSSRDGTSEDPHHYYGSPSPSSMGIQGAGRGRGGRKSATRNPLGVSVNGSNARNTSSKYDQNTGVNHKGMNENLGIGVDMSDDDIGDETRPDQGIISAAIANATALLRNPLGKGQENMGVLDQQAKSAPSNSQFTFTCEAEAKGVKFPEQSLYSPDYSQRVNSSLPQHSPVPGPKYQTQTSQSHPNASSQHPQQMRAPPQPAAPGSSQGRKPRRRKSDVYALAARQRKLQQEYMNLQHPPAPEDIWVCEFCEYESIFGEPPRALIRQYEIKDRRERKRLAEKQRLLEKAKLKGRKGKKQTKNAARAANHAAQQPINQHSYDQSTLDPGDEYLDDGYDDDPAPMPAPVPPNIKQPVMPGSYHAGKAGAGEVDRGGTR